MIGAIIAAVLVLAILGLTLLRLRIPRDMRKEGPDDLASIAAYDQVSRWWLFYAIRWLVIRRLKIQHPQGTLVDAGCGPGYLAAELAQKYPGLEIVGIDILPRMIELAEEHSRQRGLGTQVRFEVAAVEHLPLATASVDFVVSTLSLHHWVNPQPALAEIYRVLKPGGQLLIFDLRRDMPWLLFWIFHLGQRWLAPPDLNRINGAVGSVWASLTPPEMGALLVKSPFAQRKVRLSWGWAWLWAKK